MLRLLMPFRFKVLRRRMKSYAVDVLDVGCGNHSPTVTARWLFGCRYHGVDRRAYNNDEADFRAMHAFYEIDLVDGDLDSIPDRSFDVVIAAHIIEHLPNGLEVLQALVDKLRPGGLLYVEFPSWRSLSLPRMKGSLNFFDDPTHVRVFTVPEVANALLAKGCRIERAGRRRDWARVLLSPLLLPAKLLVRRRLSGFDFWDLLGFADLVVARAGILPGRHAKPPEEEPCEIDEPSSSRPRSESSRSQPHKTRCKVST